MSSVFNYPDHAAAISSLKPNKKRKLANMLMTNDQSFDDNEEIKNDGTNGYYYIKTKNES